MKPLTKKDILKKSTETLSESYSENLVTAVVDAYYKDVRLQLSSGQTILLKVHKLGYFKMMPWALEKKIQKHSTLLENRYRIPRSKRDKAIQIELANHLNKLLNMRELLKIEEERRDLKKVERKEYDQNR